MDQDKKYFVVIAVIVMIPFVILILFNGWGYLSPIFFPEYNPVAVICGPRVKILMYNHKGISRE